MSTVPQPSSLSRQLDDLMWFGLGMVMAMIVVQLVIALIIMEIPALNAPCRHYVAQIGIADGIDIQSMLGVVEETLAPDRVGPLPRCQYDPDIIRTVALASGAGDVAILLSGLFILLWRAGRHERAI